MLQKWFVDAYLAWQLHTPGGRIPSSGPNETANNGCDVAREQSEAHPCESSDARFGNAGEVDALASDQQPGTVAVTVETVAPVTAARTPPKKTKLFDGVTASKPDPEIVTEVPVGPDSGVKDEMVGPWATSRLVTASVRNATNNVFMTFRFVVESPLEHES